MTKTLTSGDRVAYAASFLKSTGQHTGAAPQRRGTFVSYWVSNPDFARVHWDDFEQIAPQLAEQYGDDYVADARSCGSLVHAKNIAKIGSARFALT
ncbi:hypothetical protein HAP48_0042815 [Bradyrhizobium septentrionale]|uniref:Uncharacterized protein n=1 Tax=Bradyrhizobium septentrionale TaxID=1404411 RepID=A0A973W2W2_9BRAD|nr:hypothetical protein [Bradyrhizobium septentrionale]UGY15191.1 hypothetical protein HAP48_0042815 [Bradyrhizobium septentrionale]